MDHENKEANGRALFPIIVFLCLYLGTGIYFEFIRPVEGQMGFYVMSVVVAFSVALIVAFLQNPKQSFEEKIHCCAESIGDDNITIMLFIFLMAGAVTHSLTYVSAMTSMGDGTAGMFETMIVTILVIISIIGKGKAKPAQ